MTAGVLIVGASQAGLQVAHSLRDLGWTAPITVVGAEPHAPYQRPPLSKAYLTGKATAESLAFRAPDYYAEHDIDLVLDERILSIELSTAAPGGTATSAAGRTFQFDALALTVGARPRRLAIPGHDLDGIVYVRDIVDAERLKSRLDRADRVVVIGGGFIGLEAAAVARQRGKDVTVVEAAPRLIPRAVAPVVSQFYREAHERRGTTIMCDSVVTALTGSDGAVTGVVLSDGNTLPADLVIVGIGILPRTELADQLGIKVAGGIVVDENARTSSSSVVAAGDCTVLPDPTGRSGMIRLESVQNAVDQSKVAAATLVGITTAYDAVPWFWSDQDTMKLQIAGLSLGYDEFIVRGDVEAERFSVLYFRDGRFIAIDSVNRPADFVIAKKVLAAGQSIEAAGAADSATSLKKLVV